MVGGFRVHRDRDLDVIVLDLALARLEERHAEPGLRPRVVERAVEGRQLPLAREPVLQDRDLHLEFGHLAPRAREVGDQRPGLHDLIAERGVLRAELRQLRVER